MLQSMSVTRERVNDVYNIRIDVPEKEYFEIYDDLDKEAARDILKQYMIYHGDEGRFEDTGIDWDKGSHIVSISAKLSYFENDHTEEFTIPTYLDVTRRDGSYLDNKK